VSCQRSKAAPTINGSITSPGLQNKTIHVVDTGIMQKIVQEGVAAVGCLNESR
jgi:hypothetical protein